MIFTFYSYKGGVGRTMALANVAELFYQAGLKVLMVDWDMEAPGLERYFFTDGLQKILDKPGLIDMLLRFKEKMAQEPEEDDPLVLENPSRYIIDVYPEQSRPGKLFLLTSGRRSKPHFTDYARSVLAFDWQDFYKTWGGELYFNWLREQFNDIADVTLIDSRTGVTEMGGVCTYHLADTVIMFCTPNQQNLEGTYYMAKNFTATQLKTLRPERPLSVLIIPARIERAESELLDEFQNNFIKLFKEFAPHDQGVDINELWQMGIPYIPKYSYTEEVVTRETSQASSEDMESAFIELSQMLWRLTLAGYPLERNILIIDSEIKWLEEYKTVLEPSGYNIEYATKLSEAVNLLDKKSFDIVITEVYFDLKFPSVWSEVAALFNQVAKQKGKIIIITGVADRDEMYNLFEIQRMYKEQIVGIFFKDRFNSYKLEEAVINTLQPIKKYQKTSFRDTLHLAEEYLDFDLHVGPDGHVKAHSYLGETMAQISVDLPDDIILALNPIENNHTNEGLLKSTGRLLCNIIFSNPIHIHFSQSEAVARSENKKIRLKLTIEPDTLALLPWELTFREEGGYFLSVNPQIVLSHYLNVPLPQNRVRRREDPLHLLLIIADPIDQPQQDSNKWEKIIVDALTSPLEEGMITIRIVKRATRREISKALAEQRPDIVQFVGHGIYRNGKGYLALVDDKTDKTWEVDDERFTNIFLGSDDNLGLLCLTTCENAKSDSPQGFLSIAPKIVQKGVPAVVAMRYSPLVSTSEIFFEEFYEAIAARKPVDWAVQWARNQISLDKGLDNREFATPVLYMRIKDGMIF